MLETQRRLATCLRCLFALLCVISGPSLTSAQTAILIDFEEFPVGPFTGFLGTEDGIEISAEGGIPFIDDFDGEFGNPGNGFFNDQVGSTTLFSFLGPTRTFDGLDAIGGVLGFAFADIVVEGYLNGTLQGTEVFSPQGEYLSFSASNLAGIPIDRLDIYMPEFGVSADNVLFSAVPETQLPAAWLSIISLVITRRATHVARR